MLCIKSAKIDGFSPHGHLGLLGERIHHLGTAIKKALPFVPANHTAVRGGT